MYETDDSPASNGAIPSPPPLPDERRAAWWAWPLVFLCLIPFDRFIAPTATPPENETVVVETGVADLALLKLQGQIVIASAKLDPKSAEKGLDDLAETVHGDRAVAALALLEGFIQPDSPRVGSLLDRFSRDGRGDLATITEKAVSAGVGDEDRERLRVHLGWFADLARGPGLAAPPLDSSIRARAVVVFAGMGLAFALIVVALLCGAVLLVLYLRQVKSGEPVNAFSPTRRHTGVLLESFALYLGIMTFGALAAYWWGAWIGIASYGGAVVVPLLWPGLRGVRWGEFCLLIGLNRGRGWLREIGAGCVGYMGVLAIASIGISITLALTLIAEALQERRSGGEGIEGAGGPSPGPEIHPVVGWIYEGDVWVRLACLLLAAGFAPLFEELFFRGALQRYLRGRFRFWVSALLSSVIFAALHPQGFYAIPALAGIGIGFSLLREWRDSLIAPMTAHAINNGCLVGMLWWIL